MSKFVSYDILSETNIPIRCARLEGDGWAIDVSQDGDKLEIRCHGQVVGSDELMVIPHCSNVVRVMTNIEYNRHVHEAAAELFEVHLRNEEFRKKHERTER